MSGWRWWRDCRILALRHWTSMSDDPRYLFRCVDCGWQWGKP